MKNKIATILLLSCAAAFAAEKHPWGSFKPGSYAKMKTTTTAGPTKMTTEMTQTLISVDANNAVVEMESKMMGQSTKSRMNVPLKSDAKATATAQGKAPTPTNETIAVGGKSIACKCYDMETSANGMKTSTRSCTSDAVPGGAVKVVSKTSGAAKSESVMELVDFVAK